MEIIEQFPLNHDLYNHLAVLYSQQGRWKNAIENINQALALQPYFPLAHYNLAVFLYQVGDVEGALMEFRKAAEQEPLNPLYQLKLGMYYWKKTRRPDLGRQYLKESLRLDPYQNDAGKIQKILSQDSANS